MMKIGPSTVYWVGSTKDSNDRPPSSIPEKAQPTFDGLLPHTFSNMHTGQQIFAKSSPTPWPPKYNANLVLDPDPDEEFDHITNQLFWNSVSASRSSCKYEWFFVRLCRLQRVTCTDRAVPLKSRVHKPAIPSPTSFCASPFFGQSTQIGLRSSRAERI